MLSYLKKLFTYKEDTPLNKDVIERIDALLEFKNIQSYVFKHMYSMLLLNVYSDNFNRLLNQFYAAKNVSLVTSVTLEKFFTVHEQKYDVNVFLYKLKEILKEKEMNFEISSDVEEVVSTLEFVVSNVLKDR